MATPVEIINLGLGKVAASLVTSLTPARTPIEKHCANGYPHWRDSELSKRRWTFALKKEPLTRTTDDPYDLDRPYRFSLPNDCIRPLRDKHTVWRRFSQFLHSPNPDLVLEYTARVNEAYMDPLFIEVLACRVAKESVEFATQSNTKGASIDDQYRAAVNEAGRNNAFLLDVEDMTSPDESDEWVLGRFGVGT